MLVIPVEQVPWQMRQNYKVHWVVDIISKDHRRSDVNDNEKLVSADDKTGESLAAVNGSEAAQVEWQQNSPSPFLSIQVKN